MEKVLEVEFESFETSVPEILEKSGLASLIANQKRIIIKPNLTIDKKPPCTTPVELVEEVIKFCKNIIPEAKIIIVEGAGGCDTQLAFKKLSYNELAEKYQIKLTDLNREKRVKRADERAKAIKEVMLPEIIFSGFFINLPVLKEHHEAILTCAAKNLFGIYLNESKPPGITSDYWSKNELHSKYGVMKAIWDLNLYRPSDFVLVDASIGQKGSEVYGEPCKTPIKKLFAGYNNFEVDRYCAPYLGIDPNKVEYLTYQ
ncbi:MAG: DUF362 domain-containing protein [Candidatus Berkelbacteria bacterium]|nr:DUF362 domain-containing protein [Candidatus Berkelbacteria bacterium]